MAIIAGEDFKVVSRFHSIVIEDSEKVIQVTT